MRRLAILVSALSLAAVTKAGELVITPIAQSIAHASDKALSAALQMVLLEQHGRLLPRQATSAQLQALANIFLPGKGHADEAAKLPPADTLIFDGEKLAGGNFSYIDNLIGKTGRPIALDRQLPTVLVPLSTEAANALAAERDKFAAVADPGLIRARTDRLHIAKISAQLVADGLFLRAYAGRMDDLYVHFVQDGTAATQLQFYSILDGLPQRTYHPLAGIGGHQAVPPIWFSASDLLSAGALSAVERFHAAHPGRRHRNPFMGIAARVIPFLREPLAGLAPGSELAVSGEVFAQAGAQRGRFSPVAVPPLFRDPARFLGARAADFIRVKSAPSVSRAEIERQTPLPEKTAEPAANEALKPDSGYWENPEQASAPEQAPAPQSRCRVAVLSPTVVEAEEYVVNIAANEALLSANARALNRADWYLRWLGEARETIEDREAIVVIEATAQRLGEQAAELRRVRLDHLTARADLRRVLENRLRTERRALLQKRSGAGAL